MKRLVGALIGTPLGVAVGLGVAACGHEFTPQPSPAAEAPAEPVDVATEAYLLTLQGEGIHMSDEVAISLGEAICGSLSDGQTYFEVGGSVIAGGWDPYDAGFIIGAAHTALCPEVAVAS